MARLKDIGYAWQEVGPWSFAKRVYHQTQQDNLLVWAAALAYSWLFALFPFLIFCLALLSLVPDGVKPSPKEIQTWVDAALVTPDTGEAAQDADDADPEAGPLSQTIAQMIESPPGGGWLTLSLFVALFTASGGMAMTMAGLDRCYDVKRERPLYKSRPIAILLTIVMAVLILAAVGLMPLASGILTYVQRQTGTSLPLGWLIDLGRYAVGTLLLFGVLAMVYRWGPSVRTRMHLFSPGSIICVLMWFATAYAFQFYLDQFGAAEAYARTYGAVAGVAVLMMVFYLDALAVLIGAEINSEIDFIRLGIRSGDLPPEEEGDPVPESELDDEDIELREELKERTVADEEGKTADARTIEAAKAAAGDDDDAVVRK